MADEKKFDPFKPQQPHIPGVPEGVKAERPAPPPPKPLPAIPPPRRQTGYKTDHMPANWVALIVAACLVCVGLAWWSHRSSAKQEAATAQVEVPPPETNEKAKPAQDLPMAPGEVATTAKLEKVWSSQKFMFHNQLTSEQLPAMVVRLPGGVLWGFSLKEPFGTCEMEYITDLKKLERDYNYQADHPMVGDPCNHAVFDLTKYGSGPNGLVRGQIMQGAAVRPPLAIEMSTRGDQVWAVRIE
jgi:hypothetical protein